MGLEKGLKLSRLVWLGLHLEACTHPMATSIYWMDDFTTFLTGCLAGTILHVIMCDPAQVQPLRTIVAERHS